MTKEGMVIAVPQEKPDEQKPIANAHFILMGSHTPLDKEIGKTQIRQFHFRRQALKKHPDKNPGKEKEAAEEFKKLKAAMEVIDFIYADEKNYDDADKLKFIRVLVDEPEYAEQILRNKASKDRCDLIVLKKALEAIVKNKSRMANPEQRKRAKQYSALLQIVERLIPEYTEIKEEKIQPATAADLKSPYGNIQSSDARQQFVLALLGETEEKQKEILVIQAKINCSHVADLIRSLNADRHDRKQLYDKFPSYSNLLKNAKDIFMATALINPQQLDLFDLLLLQQCILEKQPAKKEKTHLSKMNSKELRREFRNEKKQEDGRVAQGEADLQAIKKELKEYKDYLLKKYPNIESRNTELIERKKWDWVCRLYNHSNYNDLKNYYIQHQRVIEDTLSANRDNAGERVLKYIAAFFMTIARKDSTVLWNVRSKVMLTKVRDIMFPKKQTANEDTTESNSEGASHSDSKHRKAGRG